MTEMSRSHAYHAELVWEGNTGEGTTRYDAYQRCYRVLVAGKPELRGSADPAFRGDASLHNPEDLFLAAISSCHMLTYLALCAREGISVLDYRDHAAGELVLDVAGGGRFESVTLRPEVTLANPLEQERALQLHALAHQRCFIASSCSVPITHQAVIRPSTETAVCAGVA
jgi:organic hydroperoxide reductase OsmC/OhrA